MLLEVVLDEACSGAVLAAGGGSAAVSLRARNDCVLLEPRLLVLLVRAWRHFDTDQVIMMYRTVKWWVNLIFAKRIVYRDILSRRWCGR